MSEEHSRSPEAGPGVIVTRLKQLTTVVAPTTMITSLLFYFGYIATRSRFDYFGVYLDMTDLSNQNLLLYGLEVVYVPASVAFLAAVIIIVIHGSVRWLLASNAHDTTKLLVAAGAALVGLLLVGRALVGLLVPAVENAEVPGTTALALAAGPVILAYGAWIAGHVTGTRSTDAEARAGDARGRFAQWYAEPPAARLRRGALACVAALVVIGLFWAAHQFAWAYGKGLAYDDALGIPKRPGVILATRDQITELPRGISETSFGAAGMPAKEPTFRYRYQGLRLLLASGGRLFLVPEHWTPESRTLVIPYDNDIRIQLLPPPDTTAG